MTSAEIETTEALFEQLRDGFNQGNYRDRRDVFVECVRQAVAKRGPGATILDIGCGYGIRREREPQRRIVEMAGQAWGLDPDPAVEIDPGLFQKFWSSTLEDAPVPPGSVDVAYAHMVVEHVADAPRFAAKLHDLLKPGGCAVLLTINAHSYLGRVARAANRLRAQDAVLRWIRGKQEVEDYHYPALYRFNDEDAVKKVANAAGFATTEFAYLDRGEARIYFPRPLRWIPRCLEYKHRALQQRTRLTNLLIVLSKGGVTRPGRLQ
jgi:SAM-dependent methyltransferase